MFYLCVKKDNGSLSTPAAVPKTKKDICKSGYINNLRLLIFWNNFMQIYIKNSVLAECPCDIPVFGERESRAESAASDSSMLVSRFLFGRFTIRTNFQNLIVLRMGMNNNLNIIFLVPRYCELHGCVFFVVSTGS